MPEPALEIRELGLIGDRRSAAVVGSDASILWYCPRRFDHPSLFAGLLDSEKGGQWRIVLPGSRKAGRSYLEESGVLASRLETVDGILTVTDWMPMGENLPSGVCRMLSPAPGALSMVIDAAPDYARRQPDLQPCQGGVSIDNKQWLLSSHPPILDGGTIRIDVPQGQAAWAALLDAPHGPLRESDLRSWLDATLKSWRELAKNITYHGPFEEQVAQSLRALRLLTHAPTGGIVAAATASLPEVPGGERNYDYRYVWMRDAGMIVSALVRAGSDGAEEKRFLEFICGSRKLDGDGPLLPPFLTLDFATAPEVSTLDLAGYADSRPVRIGNGAGEQLQLDGFGNVLLAAKLIYGRFDTREHWDTVEQVADYLAAHWHEPDHGIWEENTARQYTTSKVIASCGLRYIADLATDEACAHRWRAASADIDAFIAQHCLASDGAYASYAGGEEVDISSVLYPTWAWVEADAPPVLATVRRLERDYSDGLLYWRRLEDADSRKEGAFLAGTIWVAQYWVMRNELERTRKILETALAYANDLGLFAEEAEPMEGHTTGRMLGNFPQTFVHAAFIGAVIDYRDALAKS